MNSSLSSSWNRYRPIHAKKSLFSTSPRKKTSGFSLTQESNLDEELQALQEQPNTAESLEIITEEMNYTVENAALIGDAQELPYQEFENLQNLSEREEESEGDIWDPLFQEDIFQHDSRLEIEQEPGSESLTKRQGLKFLRCFL